MKKLRFSLVNLLKIGRCKYRTFAREQKINIMTPLNKLLLSDIFESNQYETIYEAYDKVKNCWCFVTIPNVKTSWTHSIEY